MHTRGTIPDSRRGVAQLVEQRSPKPQVAGSNPVAPAISIQELLITLQALPGLMTQSNLDPVCAKIPSMRIVRWLLPLLVALFAVGCGNPNEQIVGGTTNKDPVKSIISLSPSTTEIVSGRITMGPKVIGVTESCNWPLSLMKVADPPQIVMKGIKPNYEQIVGLRPDLIVYDAALFSEQDIQKINDLKIRTFSMKANTLQDFFVELYKLGTLTGTESFVNDYVVAMKGVMERGKVPIDPKPKVAIIMPGQGSEHYIVGTESFQADMVKACGGEPVGPKGTIFVAANAEELVSMNPDVILSAGVADSLRKDARLQNISAIKNNRVMEFNPDVITRRGGRVDRVMEQICVTLRNSK